MNANQRVLVVVGTRPEVIKMAPVFHAIENSNRLDGIFCVTGQHSDMLDKALEDFQITPSSNLKLMTENQSLDGLSSKLISGVSRLLEEHKPNLVLVHGDTTTAFCSAYAAFLAGIDVGHVEAGLRTHNTKSPFPEEANRQLIGRLAKWHFAPTFEAKRNLQSEGVKPEQIFVTGNTSVDSLKFVIDLVSRDIDFQKSLRLSFEKNCGFDPFEVPYILVTSHRRENFGEGLKAISEALIELTSNKPEWRVVLPVHPNPSVAEAIKYHLSGIPQISLVPPLPFYDLIYTLQHCKFVVTDSGGIQEEAVSLGKSVLVTRSHTERPEGLKSGLLNVVGTDHGRLIEAANHLMKSSKSEIDANVVGSPYGDGAASKRIVEVLESGSCSEWRPAH
jgi:UDP-N-acetylglucosamine 2-epimerase (non-hydrolysing)